MQALQRSLSKAPATQRGSVQVCRAGVQPHVGIFGTKAGMMTYFTENGLCLPATVIALESSNKVTMVKTKETDGYHAVQVGYKVMPESKVTKPELGHLAKSGSPPLRHIREFRMAGPEAVAPYVEKLGQDLPINELFTVGCQVDVIGTTIGKGTQGTIKRFGHRRGLMSHGSKSHREHGSTGPGTTPGRTFPGLKMAGRMGNQRRMVKALEVLKVDAERNAIVVKGSVPGKAGNLLEITRAKVVGTTRQAKLDAL